MANSSLGEMSLEELQSEIRRRERRQKTLQRKREKLLDQVREVESELAELGAAQLGGSRRRARNDQNLADALVDLLKDQTLNVTSIAEEVQRAGYRTTSPNFRTIVNQTLIKDDRFKRVGRGLYTAGGSGSGGSSRRKVSKKGRGKKKRSARR